MPATTTASRGERWRTLDAFRGVAVLAAVSWHVFRLTAGRGMDSHAVPMWFWPLGTARFSVDVFFVLSGLLVVQSWSSTREHAANWFHAAREFIVKRARRILPAYWVSLVVLVPLLAAPLLDHPRRILAFVTLNQYVRFWLPDKVNPVTWSLTTEWHFYLLVPLVAWLLRRVGHWPVLVACVALTFAWWMHPPFLLPSSFVFGRLDQFVAGAVAGQLAREARNGAPHVLVRVVGLRGSAPVVAFGFLALGTYHGSHLGMGDVRVVDALTHPVIGLLTAGLLLRVLTSERPTRLPALDAFAWFGTISFGLYLWHYPILDHGLRWLRAAAPMPDDVATILGVPALVALSVAVATLSFVLIEAPFTRTAEPTGGRPRAGTIPAWPSPRSWASRPSTESLSAVHPTPTRSSRPRC
jgi:peptidoglycan/LPS O-acetylase OafA/YrhL